MAELPILDLERDPPKIRRSWAGLLLGAIIAIVLLSWVTIDPVSWFPVIIVSVAIHEIGHLIAGKLVGMNPGGIVVCGLMIFKSGEHWRCHFDYRRLLSGGIAKPLPKKGDFDPTLYAWMVAGGPLATILLAAVSGIAWWISGAPDGWLSSFLWINLVLFASTLIPTGGINKSDGARLSMLLRDPEDSRSWIALLQVMAQETAGVLPRDWDPELVAQMLQYNPKNGDNAYRQMLAFYRRADERNEPAALEHLETALAASGTCGRPVRHWCFLEAACSSALLRGNPNASRTWMARATKLRKPISRHSIDAALAQSEHRYEDALRSWDAALADLVRRKLDSGLVRCSRARMEEYRSQCREALMTAPPVSRSAGA